jgi:hypothetical protein
MQQHLQQRARMHVPFIPCLQSEHHIRSNVGPWITCNKRNLCANQGLCKQTPSYSIVYMCVHVASRYHNRRHCRLQHHNKGTECSVYFLLLSICAITAQTDVSHVLCNAMRHHRTVVGSCVSAVVRNFYIFTNMSVVEIIQLHQRLQSTSTVMSTVMSTGCCRRECRL